MPGDGPILRPARADDLEAVAELEARCFEDTWSTLSLSQAIASARALVLVAEQAPGNAAAEVVGYAVFRLLPGEAELLRLATLPGHRRRGIAVRLLDRGLEALAGQGSSRCFLEVRRDNGPARALYEAAGFRPIGSRRAYYPDGTDAVLYGRPVGEARPP